MWEHYLEIGYGHFIPNHYLLTIQFHLSISFNAKVGTASFNDLRISRDRLSTCLIFYDIKVLCREIILNIVSESLYTSLTMKLESVRAPKFE